MRGTPAPQNCCERGKSPVDTADRPRLLVAARLRSTGRCTDDCQTRQALSTYPRPSTALSTIPLDSESRTARWINASGEVETMLIQRLRVLLLHSCHDHVVAYCPTCRR